MTGAFSWLIFTCKGQRASRVKVLHTLGQLRILADQAKDIISKNKAQITQGLDGKEAVAGVKRKPNGSLVTPRKAARLEDVKIEGARDKKSAIDGINLPYILWGNSQKVQVAGVCCLVPLDCR